MAPKREVIKVYTPAGHQGFLGTDHIARPVIQGTYIESDPFILLMDDMLDKQNGEPVGGPHPHAGFETVSLLLEGEMGDAAHKMKSGDLQIMTAGSGIIHTETIETKAKMRLLQLWLNLPKKDRWVTPRVQDLSLDQVPQINEDGIKISVYSGSLAGLISPIKNYTSLILADIHLRSEITTIQQIPAHYNAFLYIIEGNVKVGEPEIVLQQDQVEWLNKLDEMSTSDLLFKAGETGVRFILYAGEPLGEPIESHGPFIGDKPEDIKRLYREYRGGKMQHISTVAESQRIKY